MRVVPTKIADLQEGSVLGKDLYVENRLLMKKGSVLTKRIITLLKNRYVYSVDIEASIEQASPIEVLQAYSVDDTPNFFETLAELSTERRYGHALKNMNDILFVRDLFEQYMQNSHYRRLLQVLQQYDTYNYQHAVDVFTLCTLFAKKEGIPRIEQDALGFLFHDIGKLNIPLTMLNKKGKLSLHEFTRMKQHTQLGYEILKERGLDAIAYLAKSHHERIDGSGYPEGLEGRHIPKEVRFLQLIDMYSALTMTPSYRQKLEAAEAIMIMYKERHLLDHKLLARFVDFLGIYPENAIVLLSDGTHAFVEQVNHQHPLLPMVRRLETNDTISLPINFQLKIEKLITYQIEKPEQLFYKFSDYLLKGEEHLMEKYYNRLKDQYTYAECFTKIYLPIYQIVKVMDQQLVLEDRRLKLRGLLNKALLQLRQESKKGSAIIFWIDQEFRSSIPLLLIEGIFYSKGLYPMILENTTPRDELVKIADYCEAKAIFVFSKDKKLIDMPYQKWKLYHMTAEKLEQFVFSFAGLSEQNINIRQAIETYQTGTTIMEGGLADE